MKYKKAIISAFIAGSAGFVLGYDMGISGGTITNVATHFNLNSAWEGFALSVFIVGAVLGSIFTRKINDELGRKRALIIGTIFMLIGAIGVYLFGDKFQLFLLCRGIAGAGMDWFLALTVNTLCSYKWLLVVSLDLTRKLLGLGNALNHKVSSMV